MPSAYLRLNAFGIPGGKNRQLRQRLGAPVYDYSRNSIHFRRLEHRLLNLFGNLQSSHKYPSFKTGFLKDCLLDLPDDAPLVELGCIPVTTCLEYKVPATGTRDAAITAMLLAGTGIRTGTLSRRPRRLPERRSRQADGAFSKTFLSSQIGSRKIRASAIRVHVPQYIKISPSSSHVWNTQGSPAYCVTRAEENQTTPTETAEAALVATASH